MGAGAYGSILIGGGALRRVPASSGEMKGLPVPGAGACRLSKQNANVIHIATAWPGG